MSERDSGTGHSDAVAKAEATRGAVELVLRDVEAVLGPDALTVVTGTPEQLSIELEVRGFHRQSDPEICAWVFPSGGGATGIWISDDASRDQMVVSVAAAVQEGIIEGRKHWGTPFPPCRKHPNHPMDAEVVGGVASWVCPQGTEDPIAIGSLESTRL